MEQFRQVGEALGSIKSLMAFKDEIRINQRQCSLLVDVFNLGFEGIAEEIKQNLKFDERTMKWKALEHPLKELYRVVKGGEFYIRQWLETRDWRVKAICSAQNTTCVDFHLHNFLWCVCVVHEAIEAASEIAGCDQEEIQKKRVLLSKKYDKDWLDPKLFQRKFGKQYLVSPDICNRLGTAMKEDRWVLLDLIREKRGLDSGALTKYEQRTADLLFKNFNSLEPSKGELLPSSILVGSKDYQVRRRLGSGSQFKEIQWMGESFAVRHFFADIEPLIPEISFLSGLAHPNIMNFLCGFCDEEKKECFLVMELMNRDLSSHIKEVCCPRKRIPFSLPVAVDMMLQIARGMEYLHVHKIYHGDLNPSNILVRTRGSFSEASLHIKVGGFGLTTIRSFSARSSTNQTALSPFIWYAPEVLEELEEQGNSLNSKYSEKADVYSFAMICFELLTGKVPFEDGHLQGDKMSRNIRAGERPLFPSPSLKYLVNFTKRCWQSDPAQRPSFSSICKVLRYLKRFLIMNPDHSQPDPPVPPIDCFELDASVSKSLVTWVDSENVAPISHIPFQMFAYRVIEKDRTTMGIKERSSESGSEGASVCGDDNVVLTEDPFSVPMLPLRASQINSEVSNKKASAKKPADAKASKSSVQQNKGKTLRPPQMTPCGRSLRMYSESQLQPAVMSPSRHKASGHASDSDIP